MTHQLIRYQAANVSYEETIKNFVVRKLEFEKVITDIRTSDKNSSFQHYVFIGRRGSGKSTLLRRIEAEIKTDKKLNKNLECVNLSEEQSGIYKFYDLWDYVIRDLNSKGYQIEEVDFRDYKENLKAYTKKLHAQIITAIKSKKKQRLILLIDNIDRILKNLKDDADLFRELLMNYLDIRIIGGSTYMHEQFWKYDKAFYQFFKIINLGPLTNPEIKAQLKHWSTVKNLPAIEEIIEKHPGKIESIRMLTDGTPRTMLIFVDMILNQPSLKGYDYLKNIVDSATPIYQERLAIFSPAQRKVITELAFLWEAVNVETLVSKCKLESKTISALLNQLYKLNYVVKINSTTKNHIYRIEERFFNLWLIITQGGPQQRQEAKFLSSFLENWYDNKELNKFIIDIKESKNYKKENKHKFETYSNNLSTVAEYDHIRKETYKNKVILISREVSCLKELAVGNMIVFKKLYQMISTEKQVQNISYYFIIGLLIYKQINLSNNLFDKYKILKEKYKPLYLVTSILKKTNKSAVIKIPPELDEIINDILAYIKKEQEKMANTG